MKLRVEFKWEDLWVGIFIKRSWDYAYAPRWVCWNTYDVWICVIPCLPLHLSWNGATRNYQMLPRLKLHKDE